MLHALLFLFQDIQRLMIEFDEVAGGIDDIGIIYRNLRPVWASDSVAELVTVALNITAAMPVAR